MNARFLPPLIALAAGLAWLGYQHRRLEMLVQERAVLREGIATAQRTDRVAAGQESIPARGTGAWQAAFSEGNIRWDKLAELLRNDDGEVSLMRLRAGLEKRFAGMTPAQIEEEFERLTAMDLSKREKQLLQQIPVEELAERDPAWVVQHLCAVDMGILSWEVEKAFENWRERDLAGLTRWLDRQIAGGGLKPKSPASIVDQWARYEGEIFPELYATDPSAAFARIGKLPEKLRGATLTDILSRLEPGDWAAYLGSARAVVPAEQFAYLLDIAGERTAVVGLEMMKRLLADGHLTPPEREEMVETMIRSQISASSGRDAAGIDEIRAWGMTQAPGSMAGIMGQALGEARGDFPTRAELALRYAEQGDGDALLAAFLRNSTTTPENAALILDRISDETLRAEVKGQLQFQEETEPPGETTVIH